MPDRRSQNETARTPQPNERIRILFLIPSFKTGGAEIQLLSLVRGLDKSLFHVSVAAFYKGNELDRFYEDSPDVTVFYLNKKGALDFSLVRRLLSLIRHHKFHIVQSYNVSARLFGMITAKRAGVPISIATERTARLLYSSIGSRVYLFFEKFAIRYADILIANSNAGQEFAVSRGVHRDRTRVIYNGIDPARLQVRRDKKEVRQEFSIPMNAFLVGMVARVEALKDPFMFMAAAQSLIRKYENIYFMLVGDGALLKFVREAVSAELQSRIVFTGFRTDTADLLHSMDAVTLTSKQVEGCSNSLLEAMSLRKPVIATRVGGNMELIEHEKNGLLISPSQPVELADAVERLYHDASFRLSLAENAQRFADENFSQKNMVSLHEKLYSDVMSDNDRAGEIFMQTVSTPASPFLRATVLGCPVDKMTLDECISHFDNVIRQKSHCHIVVVNAAKVVKARVDKELNDVIHSADLVGADGMPIVWASRILRDPLPGRVNGTDLMDRLFIESAQRGWRLYLLGAKQHIIENTVTRLRKEMPDINIVGHRNGYFDSVQDEERVVERINAAQPDILLLGFGTPMKEKWVKRYRDRLDVPIIHGVGGSFDIVGGFIKRAPHWMQQSGLEWLYRLIQEPRRMWKRYLVTNSVFVWLVFKTWFHQLFTKRS